MNLRNLIRVKKVRYQRIHGRWFHLYVVQRQANLVCGNISNSEKAVAPHSSTLAWKIPWTEEPGRLQSMGLPRVGHNWATSFDFSLSCIEEGNGNPLQCVLAWRTPGTQEPGGLPSLGLHRVGHDWSDLAAAAIQATEMNWTEKEQEQCLPGEDG